MTPPCICVSTLAHVTRRMCATEGAAHVRSEENVKGGKAKFQVSSPMCPLV